MGVLVKGFTPQNNRSAFTLAELLVASVVMTTALLGVNALFQQAMGVEAQAAIRWNAHASAQAVAAHLAEAVEDIVNIPGMSALKVEVNTEGGVLICQSGLERRRYTWGMDGSETAFSLKCQTMLFSGTANLTVDLEIDEIGKEKAWDGIAANVIATRLKGISVQVKPLKDRSTDWKDRWEGRSGKVAVRIEVQVGDHTEERIILPRATLDLVE